MENKMRYFVNYKVGPSFEVSADEAFEFIASLGKKYRDDITEVTLEGEQKMVTHSFYNKSFEWECSVIGII